MERVGKKAEDEKEWRLAVRSIKDDIYINTLDKGSKRKRDKTKKQNNKKKKNGAEEEASAASAATKEKEEDDAILRHV